MTLLGGHSTKFRRYGSDMEISWIGGPAAETDGQYCELCNIFFPTTVVKKYSDQRSISTCAHNCLKPMSNRANIMLRS